MTASKLHPLAVLGPAEHPQGGLVGHCRTTYATLVALLGEPHIHCGDKTTVEWAFRCQNGTVFTVYDWKTCGTPQGPYDWHIGGNSPDALAAFTRFTGLAASSWADLLMQAVADGSQAELQPPDAQPSRRASRT